MPKAPDPTPYPIDHLAAPRPGRDGSAPALTIRERVLDHDALDDRVALLAGWLASQYPEAGQRVASWAAKGELTALLPLAAPRAGLIHVPINPLLKRAQVAHIVADSGASALFATPSRLTTLEPGDLPPGCDAIGEDEVLDRADAACRTLGPSAADASACAAILYTSGSTGRPKGVVLTHANLWLGAVSVAHYLKLRADDVTLAVLPLAFDYGQSQLFSTWYAGGNAVLLDMLFPADVARACERYEVTTLAGVPPLWSQLLDIDWPPEALRSMRRITNSGGALDTRLVAKLKRVFADADLYAMYGLTEAFRSTYLDPDLIEKHPTSMGKAVPFAQILVVNDAGEVAAAGEEGELVHCGPLVANGYWRDPERSAERFRSAPAGCDHGGMAVWSGDRVRCDEHGLLHFIGRRDAMIKSAGNRISPQEIEEAALASGVVSQAAAIGIADDRLGQAIHLVATGREEEEARLMRHLKGELPGFMQPRAVHWREAMPLNPNGKIDRGALSREIAGEGAP